MNNKNERIQWNIKELFLVFWKNKKLKNKNKRTKGNMSLLILFFWKNKKMKNKNEITKWNTSESFQNLKYNEIL